MSRITLDGSINFVDDKDHIIKFIKSVDKDIRKDKKQPKSISSIKSINDKKDETREK